MHRTLPIAAPKLGGGRRRQHARRADGLRRWAGALLAVVGAALVLASPAAAGTLTISSGGGVLPGQQDPNTALTTSTASTPAWVTGAQPPYAGLPTQTGAQWISRSITAHSGAIPTIYTTPASSRCRTAPRTSISAAS